MRFRKLPKSIRQWLRQEKARIRREIFDSKEAERKIRELVAEITMRYTKRKVKVKE